MISRAKGVFLQPSMTQNKSKIIGRLEPVNLPEWEFYNLEAKIDTGAYSSSLHCHHIEPFVIDGKERIRFYLLDPDHESYNNKMLEMPLLAKRNVKSSNGVSELRYFVKTKIEIFGDIFPIELSLTDRSAMKYPLLLGRKFLKRGPFLVDVTQENLTGKYLSKEKEE